MAASIQSGNFGSYSKPATSSTVDFAVNVSAGSNRKLAVWCVGNSGTIPYITSIKLGTVDIPPVIGCDIASGSAQVKAWVLDNPPVGAGTVHVVDGWNHIYGAYFWAVVDDAGTPTAVTGAEWANAALSLTASTPAGGIALGVGYAINGGGTALDGTTGLAMVVPDGTAAGKGSFGYTTGAGLGFTFGAANSDKVEAVLVFPSASVASPVISGTATLDGPSVAGSLASAGTSALSGGATLDGPTVNGSLGVQPGRVISEPLKTNNGTLLANAPLAHYALYNDVTGVLVVRKTGISTDALGVVDFTDPAVQTGVIYRHDWETVAGERRMPRKAAA